MRSTRPDPRDDAKDRPTLRLEPAAATALAAQLAREYSSPQERDLNADATHALSARLGWDPATHTTGERGTRSVRATLAHLQHLLWRMTALRQQQAHQARQDPQTAHLTETDLTQILALLLTAPDDDPLLQALKEEADATPSARVAGGGRVTRARWAAAVQAAGADPHTRAAGTRVRDLLLHDPRLRGH